MASSRSSSSSDSEVDSFSKSCMKAYATLKEQYDNLSSDYKKSQFNLLSYKAGLESVEARLVYYKKNETVLENSINVLELESLNEILECQVIDKFKKGLGYDAATAASLAVEESKNLDVTTIVTPSNEKIVENKGVFNTVESNTVRRECCAPINEELVSDGKKKTVVPTIPKVDVFRPKQQEKPIRKTVKYAEMYRQVNTARQKAMVNAVRTNQVNAVKSSACWGNPEIKLEDLVRLNDPKDEKRAGAELHGKLMLVENITFEVNVAAEVNVDYLNPTMRIHKDHPLDHVIGRFDNHLHKPRKNLKKVMQLPLKASKLDLRGSRGKQEELLHSSLKEVCTPIETQKPLLKDEDGEEVDVHMYRYQVNPKVSHLHAVKRIFRHKLTAAGESNVARHKLTTAGES
ncbi:hypothetical protein Tco_0636756 [Tanacetum coccineum]